MLAAPNARLDSWKLIAGYLGRDVTTAIRWEKEKGLPVHRVPGGKRHAVFAWPKEIDAWLSNGCGDGADFIDSKLKKHGDTKVGGPSGPPPPVNRDEPHAQGAVSLQNPSRVPGGLPSRARTAGLRFRAPVVYAFPVMALTAALVYLLAQPTPVPRILSYTQLTNDGRLKVGRLVTDGPRLYFSEKTPEGKCLAQVAAAGGEVGPLSSAIRNPLIQDLSLARSELLVTGGDDDDPGSLFALPLSGGLPRRIGNLRATSAAWSPDGQAVAYTAEGGIFVAQSDGTEARKIAAPPGSVDGLRWSPDGSLLRFTVNDPQANRVTIWEVRPDGVDLQAFLPGGMTAQANPVAWTSDGRYFIFSVLRSGGADLWALGERRGSRLWQHRPLAELIAGPMAFDSFAPSRDGRRMFAIGHTLRSELERYDSRAGEFVPFLPGLSADNVDFSNNGEWIAYNGFGEPTLWKGRVNGAERLQLTLPPMQIELPRWSPDGKWIAFMGREPERPWKVRVISAEGGLPESLTAGADEEGAPTWSPDGTRLIFGGLVAADVRSSGPLVIHMVDMRTHEVSTVPGSKGFWTARWSPSGRYIAALTADSKSLMLFDFSTRKWAKLLTLPSIFDIVWSRRRVPSQTGRRGEVIFLSHASSHGEHCIARLRIPDGDLEEVASLRGEPEGRWLGLTPDDSPLIVHAVGISEIYALNWDLP